MFKAAANNKANLNPVLGSILMNGAGASARRAQMMMVQTSLASFRTTGLPLAGSNLLRMTQAPMGLMGRYPLLQFSTKNKKKEAEAEEKKDSEKKKRAPK